MPAPTPALASIYETEIALQDAWARRDSEAARRISARLGRLWAERRAELTRLSRRGWDTMPCPVRRMSR